MLRALLALLALVASVHADEWQTITGCKLMDNRYNDGDSFHVLARSFGEDAALGTKKASDLRAKYDRLEAKAKRERLGAWGDGAATPTMELSGGGEEQGESTSTDVTDITPSMTDVLSVPLE